MGRYYPFNLWRYCRCSNSSEIWLRNKRCSCNICHMTGKKRWHLYHLRACGQWMLYTTASKHLQKLCNWPSVHRVDESPLFPYIFWAEYNITLLLWNMNCLIINKAEKHLCLCKNFIESKFNYGRCINTILSVWPYSRPSPERHLTWMWIHI